MYHTWHASGPTCGGFDGLGGAGRTRPAVRRSTDAAVSATPACWRGGRRIWSAITVPLYKGVVVFVEAAAPTFRLLAAVGLAATARLMSAKGCCIGSSAHWLQLGLTGLLMMIAPRRRARDHHAYHQHASRAMHGPAGAGMDAIDAPRAAAAPRARPHRTVCMMNTT
eukprot:SAG31_NODE_668_length_12945_cov_15.915849_17_plen_167_part_00